MFSHRNKNFKRKITYCCVRFYTKCEAIFSIQFAKGYIKAFKII